MSVNCPYDTIFKCNAYKIGNEKQSWLGNAVTAFLITKLSFILVVC